MEDQQRRADEQRRVDDMRRAEEQQQRHANEGYHPSEAAHHTQSHPMQGHLPPMQQGPPQMAQQGPSQMQNLIHDGPGPSNSAPKEYPADERSRMDHPPAPQPSRDPRESQQVMNEPERAARKMDVDEDYDDSGEDDKKPVIPSASASGPRPTSVAPGNKTPTSAGVNGMMGPKVEAA